MGDHVPDIAGITGERMSESCVMSLLLTAICQNEPKQGLYGFWSFDQGYTPLLSMRITSVQNRGRRHKRTGFARRQPSFTKLSTSVSTVVLT
jgi:hypothetical protein